MRVIIIFGFLATLYIVSCKELRPIHSNQRDNGRLRRYKDTKNKRGAGDYPFGLSFGGPSFSAFQSPSPASAGASFGGGFGGFGGFGGGNPLSINPGPFGISSASPSYSSLGSSGLGNLGSYSTLSQPLSLGQGSGYSLSGSGLNLAGLNQGNSVASLLGNQGSSIASLLGNQGSSLASLLGNQGSATTAYSSPSIGLFTPSDKTGPVTFNPQSSQSAQAQQYTPVYATATQLGSSSYSSPSVLSSSQGPSYQTYSQPSSVSISSLLGNNAVMYSSPSSASSSSSPADLASHAVTSNYVIAAAAPQASGSAQSYSVPLSAVASSSSPTYSIAFPASYNTASSNSASPSQASTYQLSISPSTHSSSPSSSASNHFTKYIPISSDGSTYLNKNPVSNYKFSAYVGPSTVYDSSSKTIGQQATSTGTNYVTPSSGGASQTVTSYGTPVMMFTIPSASYGTPSQHSSSSNTQYTSSSSGSITPSIGYAAASSYSNPSPASSSSSHQTDSYQKGPINSYGSSATSYISSNSNYGSSSGGSSLDSKSVSGYSSPSASSASSLSNSIENYSSASQSNTRDGGTDTSSSYSNHSPRYMKYGRPSPYIENDEEEEQSMGSSYDTISYSVPSE